jgi:hypothetical protein
MIPIYIRDILKETLFWGPPVAPSNLSFNLKHYCLQTKEILLNLSIKCWNLIA